MFTATHLVIILLFGAVFCDHSGCRREKSKVLWIRQAARSTFVNGCHTDVDAWDILSFYCDNGYKITHHAMSDNIKWYSTGVQHYSWILVPDVAD